MAIEQVTVIPERNISDVSKRLEENRMCVLAMSKFRSQEKFLGYKAIRTILPDDSCGRKLNVSGCNWTS